MAISLLLYGGKFSLVHDSAEMSPNPSEEIFVTAAMGGLSKRRIQYC